MLSVNIEICVTVYVTFLFNEINKMTNRVVLCVTVYVTFLFNEINKMTYTLYQLTMSLAHTRARSSLQTYMSPMTFCHDVVFINKKRDI